MKALRLFARTTFYRSVVAYAAEDRAGDALSMDECDAQVGALLSVLK